MGGPLDRHAASPGLVASGCRQRAPVGSFSSKGRAGVVALGLLHSLVRGGQVLWL